MKKKSSDKEGQIDHAPSGPMIEEQVISKSDEKRLACATAFFIADQLGVEPIDVGKAADRLKVKLIQCQLGLFGYPDKKKPAPSLDAIGPELKDALKPDLFSKKITCRRAWTIASDLNIGKLKVADACDVFGIKIKECQLGAF